MRQHSKPIYISDNSSRGLKRLDYSEREYDEQWLQNLIKNHPESIPINEIEPVFSDSIALCTEMETKSGYCDNVLINENGNITLIECKLWRNPTARRTVLAQILDYAKDLAKWGYSEFEESILKARKEQNKSLIEIMRDYFPDIDEAEFVDGVNENLKKARFLLLIVGDGIRENAEDLLEFLNSFGNMRFVFAFVEMPVYRVGNNEEFIITPRILAKTTELQRVSEYSQLTEKKKPIQRSQTASESVFFERLSQNIGKEKAQEFIDFVDELRNEFDIKPKMGRGKTLSYNIKTDDDRYNLASVQEDGRVYFYGIVNKTEELGDKNIGIEYLKNVAEIIDGKFRDDFSMWSWCVKKNDSYPNIQDFLSNKEEWKKEIDTVLDRIKKIESE